MSANLVIIPTYNERENIAAMVHHVLGLAEGFHILVVDDNSPDGTAEAVRGLQAEFDGRLHLLTRPGKQGLGRAYVQGFEWALAHNYDYVFEMDADFSHNPNDLPRLLRACRDEGYDMAIGSRYVTGVNVVNWPMSRVLLSYFASAYVRLVTGMPLHDATAGFKCYRAEVLRTVLREPIRFLGYAFQIEMKFKAWMYGFKIKEVPIIFTERERGQSKMTKGIVKEAALGVIRLKISSYFRSWSRNGNAPPPGLAPSTPPSVPVLSDANSH
jgi:dolichol-phosphate mannosyltransferase